MKTQKDGTDLLKEGAGTEAEEGYETITESKINTYKVRCIGISPILMNPATDELLDELEGGAGARKAKALGVSSKDKAEKKIIRSEKDEIGIPVEYLFSCLREAGRKVSYDGKSKISTKESTFLPALMAITNNFLPFLNQKAEWFVDRRRGKLPKDGTTVCIVRPRVNEWAFDVTIEVDEGEIHVDKIKELFKRAGTMVGLGDFRPSCNGQFGRFRLENFELMIE